MSITVSIDNNVSYVDSTCPDLVQYEDFPCQCADFSEDGQGNPDCWECKGAGIVRFSQYPFEINMANANFRTTFAALGLDTDDYGEMDPRVLLKALDRTPAALMLREDQEESGSGPHLYSFGIHPGQADRYQRELRTLAQEAERREEKVVWG